MADIGSEERKERIVAQWLRIEVGDSSFAQDLTDEELASLTRILARQLVSEPLEGRSEFISIEWSYKRGSWVSEAWCYLQPALMAAPFVNQAFRSSDIENAVEKFFGTKVLLDVSTSQPELVGRVGEKRGMRPAGPISGTTFVGDPSPEIPDFLKLKMLADAVPLSDLHSVTEEKSKRPLDGTQAGTRPRQWFLGAWRWLKPILPLLLAVLIFYLGFLNLKAQTAQLDRIESLVSERPPLSVEVQCPKAEAIQSVQSVPKVANRECPTPPIVYRGREVYRADKTGN